MPKALNGSKTFHVISLRTMDSGGTGKKPIHTEGTCTVPSCEPVSNGKHLSSQDLAYASRITIQIHEIKMVSLVDCFIF